MARFKITTDDGKSYAITTEDTPASGMDTARSALADAGANIKGQAEIGSYAFPPLAAAQAIKGTNIYDPKRLTDLGKGLVQGVKEMPKRLGGYVMHPTTMLQKPFSAAADIGTVADLGMGVLKKAIPDLPTKTENMGAKSLGYTKRFLKNDPMVNAARGSVRTLLEADKFPTGSVENVKNELSDIHDQAGKAIGDHLKRMGQHSDFMGIDEATAALEELRPRDKATGQVLKGGTWNTMNRKIDRAIATIRGGREMTGGDLIMGTSAPKKPITVSWEDANATKGQLQEQANYKSNKNATLLDKAIAARYRQVLDGALERAATKAGDPASHAEFLKQKKLYGAAANAMDPVYNRLSSELGNKGISLTDWILGAGAVAAGDPLTAIGEVLLKNVAEKRGPGLATKALFNLEKRRPPMASGVMLPGRQLTASQDDSQ